MNLTLLTYLLYLATAVPITIWVARVLFRNGRVFLVDVFHGREELANAVNALLMVGFYLLNLGFVALYLRLGGAIVDGRGVVEALSSKLGIVLIVLAIVHLTNVWVFNRLRRRSVADRDRRPPIAPQGFLPGGMQPAMSGPAFPPPPGAAQPGPAQPGTAQPGPAHPGTGQPGPGQAPGQPPLPR